MLTRDCLFKLLTALLFWLWAMPGHALVLSENERVYRLSADVSLLEDPTGELRLADVSSPTFRRKFQPWSTPGDISLGFSTSAYWIKLSLSRDQDSPADWLIEIPYLGLENIEFHAPDQLPVLTGSARRFSSRPLAHRFFLFPITVTTEPRDYYFRLQSHYALTVPINVWEPSTFYEEVQHTLALQALYFGGLIALLLYNFFLWVSLKDLRFLLYTLFCGLLGLGIFAGNGFGRVFIWPDASDFDVISQTLFLSAALAFAIEFAVVFLKSRDIAPRTTRLLHMAAAVCAVIALLLTCSLWLEIPRYWIYQGFVITSLIATPLIIGTGIIAAQRDVPGARFFLLAWCILLGGGVVASLRIFGLVQTNVFTAYSVQICSAAEMLLLAFALADTVRHERDAREHAQQQALASSEQLMQVMRESEQRLESAVEERTAQLNLSLATEKAVLAQYVRFGSLISHEFRNPLGIIDSQVALMRKSLTADSPDHVTRLDVIAGATQRLVKMFDKWLAEGQVRPDLRPMAIVPVAVASWLPQFLNENQAFVGGHRIETRIDPAAPLLHADKELLDIALLNLLDNACKFSAPDSTITIASCHKPGFVGISVTDHGKGVATEHQENIFEEYFRVPSEQLARGTGLGLPLVRSIVNNHHGLVELISEPGQGSTFTMWFPETNGEPAQPTLTTLSP